ncbi:MAG: nitrate reductase [Sulfurimonas sp.]|nr:nitrate reductase [Sulfurimonas sp.]MBU3937976.1 nitrate reductase [bacterium]MBU4024014.1 nitrate reductase [bacterium]MBU4058481.1 nitrate reductase [bacterium]MBU4111661.1 nitrate reductase [bacterium]
MFKLILLAFILSYLLSAKELSPNLRFYSTGYVNSFVVNDEHLYAGNDMGTVDVFDIKTQKIINRIALPLLTTVANKLIPQNIISVDYLNGKILILSIGENAYRNVWIYENYELKQIVDESKKLTIKKALFANDEKILFGTFGSEIILHDTRENYNLYTSHVTQSTMGGIVLNSDKSKMVMSYESGEIRVIDVMSSNVEHIYSSQNVDNVYDVAYSNGVIITAGQDRRVAVYRDREKDYHLKSNFLVYAVGLSPSGKTGAYSSGDEQNIQLFDTETKILGDTLVAHKSRINQIWFKNEKEIFSVGSRNTIFYWKLD